MSERLRELLVKAVQSLDPGEQREVLGELLVGATGGSPTLPLRFATSIGGPGPRESGEPSEWVNTLAVASGTMRLLPARLPTTDYDRLRSWSREHGFSMAVIIRTLVERFLDEQERGTAKAS